MRAKGRAMRVVRAVRVMRATVKMLRLFICNIYKKHLTENTALFQEQTLIHRLTRQLFQTDEILNNLFASPCRF